MAAIGERKAGGHKNEATGKFSECVMAGAGDEENSVMVGDCALGKWRGNPAFPKGNWHWIGKFSLLKYTTNHSVINWFWPYLFLKSHFYVVPIPVFRRNFVRCCIEFECLL
jgi:hypothetical protein